MHQRIKTFVQELRSRSVFRALMAYSVVSWMLLQVADVTFDRLPIPDGAMTALIVLVIIGFPITAILAWAYELTVDGIVRHEEVPAGAPRMAFFKYVLIVVAVTVGSGILMYYVSQEYWEPSQRSIAVLPFANHSSEADTDYFSDGLTEELRSLIVRLNEFRVVAMSSSYQLKEDLTDVATIAEKLGAEVVLLGSVRKFQNNVTVTGRLIDGKNGAELWSESYTRELSDIYAIQEDIARRVARALHVVLPVSANRRLKNLGTRNVDAYDAYLRGLDYLRGPADETSLMIAEGFLREAIAIDPDFANAYAALCRKHLEHYELSSDPDRFGRAEESCQHALDINEESAEVHRALGNLYLASGKYENARAAFEEALADNTNLADVYIGLGKIDVAQGRNADAEANFRRAIETDVSYWASFNAMGNFLFDNGRFLEAAEFYTMYLNRADDDAGALSNLGAAYYLAGDFKKAAKAWDDSLAIKPTRNAYSNTGSMYYYTGDFNRAADRYARAVDLAPNDFQLWGNLGDAYSFTVDRKSAAALVYKRAIELGEKNLEINPNDVDVISDLAYFYSRVGNRERAFSMDARARREAPENMYVYYNSALINAEFGKTDEALTALEHAVKSGYQPDLIRLDPLLASLREQERFRRLVSQESP